MSSRGRHTRMIVIEFIARLLRAAASALESRSAERVEPDDPLAPELAKLRRRYPDAPEHWLRVIANNMPVAGDTDPTTGDQGSVRCETDVPELPLASDSQALPRPTSSGRDVDEATGVPPGKQRHGSTKQHSHVEGESGTGPRHIGEHTETGSQPIQGERRSIEMDAPRRERSLNSEQSASRLSFIGPRFYPQPSSQKETTTRVEALPDKSAKQPRVVTVRPVPHTARPSERHRIANRKKTEPTQRAATPMEPVVTQGQSESQKTPVRTDEGSALARSDRVQENPAFVTPAADEHTLADPQSRVTPDRTGTVPLAGRNRNLFENMAPEPANTVVGRNTVFAPDEPKWPTLPENSKVAHDDELAHSVFNERALEESDRWNGLPF